MPPGTRDGVQTYSLPSAPIHLAAQGHLFSLDPPAEQWAMISEASPEGLRLMIHLTLLYTKWWSVWSKTQRYFLLNKIKLMFGILAVINDLCHLSINKCVVFDLLFQL